jgi:photosystem II stability/assembly factor-like uncharacterized protein
MMHTRRIATATAVAIAVLLPISCSNGGRSAGAYSGSGSAGSTLYATPAGVVWSLTPGNNLGQVARSTDGGRSWHVVLPRPGPHAALGLAAGYFLGPDLGWAVQTLQRIQGPQGGLSYLIRVFGTSDGGRHWWSSAPLPDDPLPSERLDCCTSLQDQILFTDSQHGWLYGMAWAQFDEGDYQVTQRLWQTSDGGRSWTSVPGHMPLEGATEQGGETCVSTGTFQVAFANQQDGWLTTSACAATGSSPLVWRTTDGGLTWTPSPLHIPPGGGPVPGASGVSAGMPWIVRSEGRTSLVVAVAGLTGLDIEASTDGGRSWHAAGGPVVATPRPQPSWFEPIDADHWVVSAPGEVIQTSDAGLTWHRIPSAATNGGPFWYTSPSQGYVRGSAGVTLATSDGGRTWSNGAAPPPQRPVSGPAVTAVQEMTPAFAVASGPAGLRVTHDGGRMWTSLPAVPGPHPLGRTWFLNPSTGFVIDQFGKQLWRSRNGGKSWTPVQRPPDAQIDHVEFRTPAAGVAFVRAVGLGVFVTTNDGRIWRALVLPHASVGTPGNLELPLNLPRSEYPSLEPACFAPSPGGAAWAVAFPSPSHHAVDVSTDGGSHWTVALPPGVLHAGTVNAQLIPWLGGCQGPDAWLQVVQSYYRIGPAMYDLLHTSDSGRSWQDALHIQNGTALAGLGLPLGPGAVAPSPLPAGLVLVPEKLALTPGPAAWQTFVTVDGGLAFAVTPDDGQHWHIHWFPPPRHAPRTAPASPTVLPVGLPWLATTATDARHAWVLLASTDGSGESYLYATSDAGATWTRITTFR